MAVEVARALGLHVESIDKRHDPEGKGPAANLVTVRGRVHGPAPAAGVDYPTGRWLPGEVVRAQFDLFVPHDAGPGDYSVSLNLVDESGASGQDTFTLAPIQVTGAGSPAN